MKIVITGSSGQVGSYLLEHFSKKHEVVGLDSKPCPYSGISDKTRVVDISSNADLREYLSGADWVLHAAAQVSVERSMEDPLLDAKNNVMGTINLLWQSFRNDVNHFLFISSAAVFGNPVSIPIDEIHPTEPMSPYGASKLCGETYVRAFSHAYGLGSVIVRPFNIYSERADPKSPYSGVISKFVDRAMAGKPLIIEGDGEQTRDFVHISDVISFIDLAIKKSASIGRTFNCGTGKQCSVSELAEIVISFAPEKVGIQHAAPRPGDIRHSCADIGLAKKLLDYFPKMELAKGLKEMLS